MITGGRAVWARPLQGFFWLTAGRWCWLTCQLRWRPCRRCPRGWNASPADLTDEAAVAHVCAEITRRGHPALDLVIHNAGVTQIGLFGETTLASQRRVMEINYFRIRGHGGGLAERGAGGKGHASGDFLGGGVAPLYKRTAYAASKHALNGFFSSLAAEEAEHGVTVAIAAPSFVSTNPGRLDAGADGIGRPGAASDGFDEVSPDRAAEIILDGWRRGKSFIPVGAGCDPWLVHHPAVAAALLPADEAEDPAVRLRRLFPQNLRNCTAVCRGCVCLRPSQVPNRHLHY